MTVTTGHNFLQQEQVMRIEEVRLGAELPELRKPITLVQMIAYAAATWDFHRYHYDPDFARAMGLPEPIADRSDVWSVPGTVGAQLGGARRFPQKTRLPFALARVPWRRRILLGEGQ